MSEANKPHKSKAATIIFAIIIIYGICFMVLFFSKRNVQVYEVVSGEISRALSTTGLIIKDEKVYRAPASGTTAYYKISGSRIKVGDPVYSLDKTGRMNEAIEKYIDENSSFSNDEKEQILRMLKEYETNYDYSGFGSVYDINNTLKSMAANIVSDVIEKNRADINKDVGMEDAINIIKSDVSGYVSMTNDGLENLTQENLNKSVFDKSNYSKTTLNMDEHDVNEGDFVYKVIADEMYNIFIQLTDEQISENNLEQADVVYVNLKKPNATIRGNFEIIQQGDLKLGKITLSKYVMSYVNDRFAEIEITSYNGTGLKVPNSAVVKRDMYVIPEEYLISGWNSSNREGFYVQEGNKVETKEISVILKQNGNCYIKPEQISEGTVLIKPDSQETYTVKATEKLDGVYNVNSGYTVFYPVKILSRNEEYAVVSESTSGLAIYDRIILNAENYTENDVIY